MAIHQCFRFWQTCGEHVLLLNCFMQSASDFGFIGSNGMEPFQLSLNQVNFETYDLGENGSDEEPLHSFSNLVSYDWDLESSENDGAPVKAKKVVPSQGLIHCFAFKHVLSVTVI